MNVVIKGLAVLTFGAVSALAPCSAAGAAVERSVTTLGLQGPLVDAEFSATDPTGCVETDVFVAANSGTEQDHPGTAAVGVASVNIYQYDACTDTTLLQAVGLRDSFGAGEFTVSKRLDRASLNSTINVTDIDTGNAFDVTVSVDWTGSGDTIRDHSNTNEVYPGCHVINRWKGSGRAANASGIISVGTTNFTPDTSSDAEIGFVVDGFEIMGCA
ncbi:MAG: hypothetical protein QOE01_996 [Actinomycetota bacterium]|nr:hypothetical protein [Actinomycetota bacterium]